MSELARFQESFAAALLSTTPPDKAAPSAIALDHRPRLAVYRNNVVTALADAVVKNHPAVERLVGTEFLRGAAAAYVRAHPPRERALTLGLAGFPDFLRAFPPARDLPYLGDVAAIDRAWLEALYAAEDALLDARALASLAPEAVAALAPGLAPSVRLAPSAYPAYSIWRMNRGEAPLAAVALDAGGETALLWRAGHDEGGSSVRHRALPPAEAEFLNAIAGDAALADAAAAARSCDATFALADVFAQLLADGVLGRPFNLETTS